eukprot:m.279160 g.279160  ORF g.279160 m.279160 type:complete len:59 (+) comp16320_c0_seq35:2535-2711(+)
MLCLIKLLKALSVFDLRYTEDSNDVMNPKPTHASSQWDDFMFPPSNGIFDNFLSSIKS